MRKGPEMGIGTENESDADATELAVSEFTAEVQGALSPFGDEIGLPLPVERLGYEHPGPDELPNR